MDDCRKYTFANPSKILFLPFNKKSEIKRKKTSSKSLTLHTTFIVFKSPKSNKKTKFKNKG